MLEYLLAHSVDIFGPLVVALLTWVSMKLATLISAKIKNESLKRVLLRLDDAVLNAVKSTEQTVRAKMAELAADGSLSDADKAILKQTALQSVRAHIGESGLAEMKKILGVADLDAVLSTRVEAAVHSLKLE